MGFCLVTIALRPKSLISKISNGLTALIICTLCQYAIADPTLRLSGRVDVDIASYDSDDTPLESGSNLRRLRLGAGGKLNSKLSYYLLADFKNGKYRAQASWLRYSLDKENQVFVGRIEIPFSLQRVSNSQYSLFMERALPAAMNRHYGTGLVFLHKGERWSFRGGLFGKDYLNIGGSQTFGNAVAARLGRRFRTDDSRWWLGASAMYQDALDIERVRFRPESSVTSQRLVDTGRLRDLDKVMRVGIEGIWKKNSWSVQAEWINYTARGAADNNLNFDGGYIEASRMFNGRRRFNFRSGEWAVPKVNSFKTWELAFRISHLDLQDRTISGGRETNYTLGVNYYFSPIARVMLNAIKVDASPNRHGVNESPSIIQARLQIGF